MKALYLGGELKLTGKLTQLNNFTAFNSLLTQLYEISWVVNARPPFQGPENLLEYLGRYIHKIAISNHRILKITSEQVTFSYLDRKDKNKKKTETIDGVEFLGRFLEHVLEKGFVKIRYYGFLSSRTKTKTLQKIRRSLGMADPGPKPKLSLRDVMLLTTGKDPNVCTCCGGQMVVIELIPSARGSPTRLLPLGKIMLEQNDKMTIPV